VKDQKLCFVEPMKARLVEKPPSGEWLYEVKFDGFRALAIKSHKAVQLLSRNQNDLGTKFPGILTDLSSLRVKQAIIDGEIVALTETGRSSFQLLQAYDLGEKKPPIVFYAFDLLFLDSKDLRREPICRRKELLEKVLVDAPESVRFSPSLQGDLSELLESARNLGLEGLIGKRQDSLYEEGKRTGSWIKLKLSNEQEFVIGGYTEPKGGRAFFGSLIVGVFENNQFLFAGKVGTGFTEASLKALYRKLEPLADSKCPFLNLPEKKSFRYSPGLTASEMKKCHWVKPKLVCQIKFGEWTRDAKLRHPVFLGMRDDKSARQVKREIIES
jgi:bifunctional non-homologous end joining protein LigD